MPAKKISFKGSLGHELSAQLDLPERETRAYAVFAHCFTCTKNLKSVGTINAALAEEGIAVLRFDFTGLGDSGGDFSNTNFSSNIADLHAAGSYLEEHYEAPRLLIGHSLGGTAVLKAAAGMPSVRAVATIGSPFDPGEVVTLFPGLDSVIREKGEAEVNIGGRPFLLRKQFLDDLTTAAMEESIANLNRPLIIFHAPGDAISKIANAQRIFQTAKHPKSYISLEGADHLLTDERDSRYVGSVIAAWADRYIR